MSENKFATGAVRSGDLENLRFDLIHPIALIALARVYGEGADKYLPFNWERGMPISSLMNHTLRHYVMFLAGDRTEPHLEHAAWGALAMIVSNVLWPHLNGDLRGPGCKPSVPTDKEIEDKAKWREANVAKLADLSKWTTCGLRDVMRIFLQGALNRQATVDFAELEPAHDFETHVRQAADYAGARPAQQIAEPGEKVR